jgi:hypothetical protein
MSESFFFKTSDLKLFEISSVGKTLFKTSINHLNEMGVRCDFLKNLIKIRLVAFKISKYKLIFLKA